MLNKFIENIWTAEQAQKYMGIEMGARMTIVDISGNKELLVHSPIQLNEKLIKQINELGTVKYVIAPSLLHHLYIGDFKKEYPKAKFYCAPGLEVKRKDFSFDEVVQENKKYDWSEYIDHKLLHGVPMSNEVVLYIKKQKTLIVTDLGMHICEDSPFLTKIFFKLVGLFDTYGWSKIERFLLVKNNNKFSESIKDIVSWDFNSIILSHGRLIKKNGHEIFKSAFVKKS